MKTHEHFAALVRLVAYKFAGSEEKAEKLVSWAYGITATKAKETTEDPTDTFIKEYLTPEKRTSNVAVQRFAEMHVGFPDEDLNYGRICAVIRDMDYRDFLLTTYWRGIALVVKERAGNKCVICGSEKNLVAHHTSYDHHGDELHHLEDLECLCKDCHNKQHGIEPEPVAETKPAPAPPRRKPRTGSTLSMSAIINGNDRDPFYVPLDGEAINAWKKMAGHYAHRPRLQNILLHAHVETTVENWNRKLTFTVSNEAQLEWVQDKILPDLTRTFQDIIGSDNVTLDVRCENEE